MENHIARNCPYRSQMPTVPSAPPGQPEVANLSYIQGCSNAYLSLLIHGKEAKALIDSGSQFSLAPHKLVRPAEMNASEQFLKAANGSPIKVLGQTTLFCQAENIGFAVPFQVTADIDVVILGLDWLVEHKVNFQDGWMDTFGHRLPIQTQKSFSRCNRISRPVSDRTVEGTVGEEKLMSNPEPDVKTDKDSKIRDRRRLDLGDTEGEEEDYRPNLRPRREIKKPVRYKND